jgi:heme A synthase
VVLVVVVDVVAVVVVVTVGVVVTCGRAQTRTSSSADPQFWVDEHEKETREPTPAAVKSNVRYTQPMLVKVEEPSGKE